MSKFVVVDEILEMLEAAKSGVVPGSVEQCVVSGVQNVPANIIQHGETAGGGCYTTFPLSPIMKNCCLDKTYLNLEFDVNFNIVTTGVTDNNIIPFYVGFRDAANIFNQVQILIENSAIITTTYQREESSQAYNALPETEIRGNNQYASIQKLKDGKYCPMKRFLAKITGNKATAKIHYKLTVDINRLMPALSNIHFTTPHFGNLKLKVWMQRIQEAMFICPDYGYYIHNELSAADKPKLNTATAQPIQNQYWCFYPFTMFTQSAAVSSDVVPFYSYSRTNDKGIEIVGSFKITYPEAEDATKNLDFMTFNGGIAEIVQTCFDIKEEEYQRLSDYFASTNSIIIPTQTFESGVFNNSGIASGNQWINTQIGTIGGYNVNSIGVWAHPNGAATALQKEFLTNVQLLLDGRPVNSLPYPYINDKAVVDCTQAIIDTDHEEINQDYIESLTCFNLTDDANYVKEELHTTYGNGKLTSSINRSYIANPNTFALNFSTNLPDAFHSGACILENSNRNGVLRLNSNNAADTVANLSHDNTATFPYVMNHKNIDVAGYSSTVVGFTAFCDCCIVLTYDAARGTCYDGQLSWAAPYL